MQIGLFEKSTDFECVEQYSVIKFYVGITGTSPCVGIVKCALYHEVLKISSTVSCSLESKLDIRLWERRINLEDYKREYRPPLRASKIRLRKIGCLKTKITGNID